MLEDRGRFGIPVSISVFAPFRIASHFVLVVQSQNCVQLCDPMDGSTPSFHVLHYFPEFSHLVSIASHCLHSVDTTTDLCDLVCNYLGTRPKFHEV